jgi:histo-blood group ABO system transferase
MKKIGLLLIATDKYIEYLIPLIESTDKYFLKQQEVTYFIFTDKDISSIETNRKIVKTEVVHKEWPWMTLGRYKIFSNSSDILSKMDYLYYCDADMLFVNRVDEEIFGKRVATQHPGHYGERGTPEVNELSLAYISPDEEMQYFAGGFNGGESTEYLSMSKFLSNNIDIDNSNGIIALWHDESHMNRYFIDNKPTNILNPSYCYGEDMEIPFDKKIIALTKNKKVKIIQDENIYQNPIIARDIKRCYCGMIQDKVRYNFCQKCNKLY